MHKLTHAVDIVRHDREAVVEYMVYRDDRNVGGDKLQHLRVVEIDRGDDDPVHAAVKAMLKICRLAVSYVLIYKCDIVAVSLGLDLETVEEYADIIGSVCLERSGGGICHVPQFIRKAAYSLAGLLSNIGLTVECLADRRDRHAAALGNFLHRNHERVLPFVFLNRLRILFLLRLQEFICVKYPVTRNFGTTAQFGYENLFIMSYTVFRRFS